MENQKMNKEVLNFIKNKKQFKLSDALRGLEKIIENEGDLEIQNINITKEECTLQIKNKFYNIVDYKEITK